MDKQGGFWSQLWLIEIIIQLKCNLPTPCTVQVSCIVSLHYQYSIHLTMKCGRKLLVCFVIWKMNYNSFAALCIIYVYTYAEILKNGNVGYYLAHCMVSGNENSVGYKISSCLHYLPMQKVLVSGYIQVAEMCRFECNLDGFSLFLMLYGHPPWTKSLFPITFSSCPLSVKTKNSLFSLQGFQGREMSIAIKHVQDLVQWKHFLHSDQPPRSTINHGWPL